MCAQERLDVETERNGVQMLMQAEGTRVCAHLYAERSRDVKMTDKCTEDRRIVYTHNYERYIESELD